MTSRIGWTAAMGAVICLGGSLWAQNGPESLLPRTASRLKPVVVVAAAEMPIVEADEPVVVKQAVVLESVGGKSQVMPAAAISPALDAKPAIEAKPAPEAKLAPVAPSWSLPKPIKKASIPMTNPYVVPRTAR